MIRALAITAVFKDKHFDDKNEAKTDRPFEGRPAVWYSLRLTGSD